MKKFLLSLVALFCILPNINNVSAQDEGNFRFGFRTGYYFRTKAYGLGVYGSYGIFDWLNIEPGVNFIFKESSSVDIYCDFTVPLEITPHCYIYPIAGISIHDITSHSGTIDGWAGGINLGLGSQYYINRRWSANAQIKWMGRLPQRHKSAVIFSLGIDYNF